MQPDYGNWVSTRYILVPFVLGLAFAGFEVLLTALVGIAVVLFGIAGYFAYARFLFGQGGDVQTKIRSLVLSNLEWEGTGKVLDIGCGNGALTVAFAKRFPAVQVTGVDLWSKSWGYSRSACERNAKVEGVKDRAEFQNASASSLPFPDGTFDIVVSNLTFHEVKDAADKRALFKEALRVLRKGGKFVFQDLFLSKSVYGDASALKRWLGEQGLASVELLPTRDSKFIPKLLKLPFMVGTLAIVKGEK